VFFIIEELLKYLVANIPLLPQLVYTNLEFIVAGVGTIGVMGYLKLKKISHNENDLTNLVIKQKKYADTVNKRSK
jgi:hypothetical protein